MKPPRTLDEARPRIMELEEETRILTSRLNLIEREFFVLQAQFTRFESFLITEGWDDQMFRKWRSFNLALNGAKEYDGG